MSTSTYELYGGPLDGATTTTSKLLSEGDPVVLKLLRTEVKRGKKVSTPCGEVIHTWLNSTLRFTSMRLLDQKPD